MKHGRISLVRLARSLICRPLAAILAILLVPMLCRIQGDVGIWSSAASAAALGGTKTVIQNHGIGRIVSDLVQLENDAITAYLGVHDLPQTDASFIYTYGRSDLRSAIRGIMFSTLLGIIAKPASQRTSHEKALYEWLQRLVQQNEIEYYKLAIDQFGKWERDPCLFTLDPVIASEYDLSYSGAPYCGGQLSNLLLGAEAPDEDYFLAYGLKNSYGKTASTNPDFGALVADTGVNVGLAWGIGAGIAATLALATGTAIVVTTVQAALATAALASSAVAESAAVGAASSSVVLGALPGALAAAAGPIAIILIAVAIGVAAGIKVFATEETRKNIKALQPLLTQVTNTPPDLSTFANDSSGVGIYKLESTFVAQTVPEVPSTAALPVHSGGDLNFAIQTSTQSQPQVLSTLTYQNWEGASWSARTSGGWFVQTCAGTACRQADSISADIRYVDSSGVKWTAMRFGDQFVSVKNKTASTDIDCPPDPRTGLSAGPNFSQCKSYISNSIPLMAPGGVSETVAFSVSPPTTPPVFANVGGALPFTPGIASSQTVTASGSPAPQVCLFSVTPPLPLPDFSLPAGTCQTGKFQLAFNGNPSSPQQNYQLFLSATNGTTSGPVLQTYNIDVSQHLMITSPAILSGTAGFPVNFQVTTTGLPPISLSVTPSLLNSIGGLTFTDNGNGTGNITGTPQRSGTQVCILINGQAGCGVIASSSQGTIIQGFGISMAPAPAASIGPPSEATFITNAPNSIVLTSVGAQTPVSWSLGSAPSWLSLADNGNGTATLFGTPPAGTLGTFTAQIAPIALGSQSSLFPNSQPAFTSYPVTVVNQPTLLSPSTATFTVGSQSSFAISATEGDISITGPLPQGLSFTAGNPATIQGTPAAGSGGQYRFTVGVSIGAKFLTYGFLTLNVNEAPSFISRTSGIIPAGLPGSFTVSTTGFPSVSATPLSQPLTPPTNPNQGKGMFFTVTGLPSTLSASNLNPDGFATGTLSIAGSPSPDDVGPHFVQITAQNGVGEIARQFLTLQVVQVARTPASGTACSGAFNGIFRGNIEVSQGQNCMFVGGEIDGSVRVIGGDFTLSNAVVTGHVEIQGFSQLTIGPKSKINGHLSITNVTGEAPSEICGSVVEGGLFVEDNAIPIDIGSSDGSCAGNVVGGALVVSGNSAQIDVFGNHIVGSLLCQNGPLISGASNTAQTKSGNCVSF